MREVKVKFIQFLLVLPVLFLPYSCKKKEDVKTIPDNNAPHYDEIPTLLVNNYVNRLYIDLIGREPLDAEMESDVSNLRKYDLSFEARDSLIIKLQTNEDFIIGDTSYKSAYYQRFYELSKTRMVEGVSDAYIMQQSGIIKGNLLKDSIEGNLLQIELKLEKIKKYDDLLNIKKEYQSGDINVNDVFARLLNNDVYDEINMNTFNFVRASFNDLFLRFPTTAEYEVAYEMIEYNKPVVFYGYSGQSKTDFINIIVNSEEFYEGIIRWNYQNLLSREPSTKEVYRLITDFLIDGDVQKIQREILKTDEYANFN